MANNSDVEELKKHPSVLRLYQERVQLRHSGREFEGICPIHSERTPSFKVRQASDGTYLWNCFGCNIAGGNIYQFLQKIESLTFNQAVDKVRKYVGGTFVAKKEDVEQVFFNIDSKSDKKNDIMSLAEFSPLETALSNSPTGIGWLKSRGINLATAKRLHVGYEQSLPATGKNSDIASKGWIAFPCIENGCIVSVEYRSVVRHAFLRRQSMTTALFNLPAIDILEPVLLVEGKTDCLSVEMAGYRCVSLPNAQYNLSAKEKDLLLEAECVILAGDNDTAGRAPMQKLWADMRERTFLLTWPGTIKDANQMLVEECKADLSVFRTRLGQLVNEAKSRPMDGIYSLAETMRVSEHVSLADHPHRLRMPWPSVDSMAVLLPGSVMALTATNTKQGKTQFTTQLSVHAARKHNEVVLNYQAELSTDEFANIVASHVLRRSRNRLTKDDYVEAANMLSGIKYYVGHNPTLNTIGPVLDLLEAAIRRLGATIVIVDHIHHLCRNQDNEIQVQANAMQRLKSLAQQYQCKVIVISQPRKAQQVSKGKSLHVTDIKGSETLTSDADAIFSLHREFIKVKDPDNPPRDDYEPETEVQLLGARSKGDGSTLARLQFVGDICTFSEISYQEENTGLFK